MLLPLGDWRLLIRPAIRASKAVLRCLQWDSIGQVADSVGVPGLRNSTAGLPNPVQLPCGLSTYSGGACQTTTCDANQHFEQRSFRALPRTTHCLPAASHARCGYLSSTAHLPWGPLPMGDVSHTQGIHTVDDSQHPRSSAPLPRSGRPPSQSADPGYAVSITNLAEAVPLSSMNSTL